MVIFTNPTELGDLICNVCAKIATPPVFHCAYQHITCSTCYVNLVNRRYFCMQSVNECPMISKLLARVQLPCPFRRRGCLATTTVSDYEHHVAVCPEAPYVCPICREGQVSVGELISHLNNLHQPLVFDFVEVKELPPGMEWERGLLLLRGPTESDFFVAVFREGGISIQHLPDAPSHRYELLLTKDGVEKGHYIGETSACNRTPQQSLLYMRYPARIFQEHSYILSMVIV